MNVFHLGTVKMTFGEGEGMLTCRDRYKHILQVKEGKTEVGREVGKA